MAYRQKLKFTNKNGRLHISFVAPKVRKKVVVAFPVLPDRKIKSTGGVEAVISDLKEKMKKLNLPIP